MGLQTIPAYIGEAGYEHPVELDRNLLAGIAGGQSGMPVSSQWPVSLVGGNSFQLTVGSGNMFLMGSEDGISNQGAYFTWSDASENFLFAGPSGSPRIDSLIMRVVDKQYGSDPGVNRAEWEIVQGTPGSSPAHVPDSNFQVGGPNYKPGAWLRCLDVRINPGDTDLVLAQVTNLMQVLRIAGGQLVVSSSSFYPPSPGIGDVVYDLANRYTVRWNGTSWESRFASRSTFTASGVWNKPLGARQVMAQVQGGGGAGGGATTATSGNASMGGGGGAGGYAEVLLDATAVASSVTVTVGNGGTGVAAADGGNGQSSSFGAHCVATGGSGGEMRGNSNVAHGSEGGAAGFGTVGAILLKGGSGHCSFGSGPLGISGNGGDAHMGGGGRGIKTITASESRTGLDGGSHGGGGSGGITSQGGAAIRGGHGAKGLVIVVSFF